MALTKETRDKLPAEHFAVPETRQLPIHDDTHVKMAWDMVDTTKGLSDAQRKSARARIIKRAHELGVDTSKWNKIKSMAFTAMALAMPETPDHPNKHPFSGILVRLDQASDAPPHGSFGSRIFLPRAVAETALPTLLGMAVNYQQNLKGHDPKAKIGVIDAATIEEDNSGPYIHISGFFYASDFSGVVTRIRADKSTLGFSFEAERIVVDDVEVDPMVIKELTFTGAAVLKKDSAAYQTTALAASKENFDMDKEEFDKLMGTVSTIATAVKGFGERLDKIEASDKQRVEASAVVDKVKPHADSLHSLANAMEKDGIGCAAAPRGHVHVIRHMADSMMSDAHRGHTPSSYGGLYSAAETRVEASAEKKELDELKKELGNVTTVLKDLQARAVKSDESGRPERKSVSPHITKLLARAGVTMPEGDAQLTVPALDTALKSLNLDIEKRMQLKAELRNAGLLAAA